MGNTVTAEYPSTWQEDGVQKWKNTAAQMQKYFYTLFGGSHFDEYQDMTVSQQVTKICFAIYGPPSDEAEDIENAYSSNQRKEAETILEKLKEVWRKCPEKRFCVGVVFVCCKQEDKEYTVPIFRLLWKLENNTYTSRYIDTSCRVYETWTDWKDNNMMPMLKYCYPTRGFYSCSRENTMVFDADKDPDISYGTSPACDLVSRVFRVSDVIITTVGIGLGLLSMITPAVFFTGPAMMGAIGGSALYGCGRAGQRLYDKATHGESLSDLESIVLMASIIAAPLSFVSCLVNAKLATGAAQGRIFSQSTRVLATVLFITTFGFDSFFFIVNIANLINKAQQNQLTKLDVLQFSISCLFFTNTLIQPKTAKGVIERAQQQRINTIANGLTDEQAKVAFNKFLKNNEHGNMQANSKIIRTLNKIENPNAFFKSNANNEIKIGGRKGRTVFVTDSAHNTKRINPNPEKVVYSHLRQEGTPKIQKPKKLKECLGCEHDKHKYLKNMNDRQKGRVSKVFGGSANYDKDIVDIATKVADDLHVKNPDEFMSVVEIVATEKKSNPGNNLNGRNYEKFVDGIRSDLKKATNIAATKNRKFADPYLATYHYRKHGEDFIQNCSMDFYLNKTPNRIIKTGHLTEVCTIESVQPDGTSISVERKTYFTSNDEMCVVIESPGKQTISTVFKNVGGWEKHLENFPITNTSPNIEISSADFARRIGLQTVSVAIHDSNGKFDAQKYGLACKDAEYYQTQIALLLSDLSKDDDGYSSD